jgi:hypothetical protein
MKNLNVSIITPQFRTGIFRLITFLRSDKEAHVTDKFTMLLLLLALVISLRQIHVQKLALEALQ